jgi:oligopeptide transport system substrate-binding protein
MYLRGQLDWTHPAPVNIMPEIRKRKDFYSAPQFTTYFYRLNVTKPPFDNVLVRRALNLAIDKKKIVEEVTQGGQLPATAFVPPGMTGYTAPRGTPFNKEEAQRLMKEAGYPNGRGLPKIEILFNNQDAHKAIAEVIQHDWQETLGVESELRPLEWGSFLESLHRMDYQTARSGWVADYSDPNTFLDMFVTGGENNETGWGNKEYDRLIQEAGQEADMKKRMEVFRRAEEILIDEAPILPIYSYVSINLVRPYVKGFHPNVQDVHPLEMLSIDKEERRREIAKEGLTP